MAVGSILRAAQFICPHQNKRLVHLTSRTKAGLHYRITYLRHVQDQVQLRKRGKSGRVAEEPGQAVLLPLQNNKSLKFDMEKDIKQPILSNNALYLPTSLTSKVRGIKY